MLCWCISCSQGIWETKYLIEFMLQNYYKDNNNHVIYAVIYSEVMVMSLDVQCLKYSNSIMIMHLWCDAEKWHLGDEYIWLCKPLEGGSVRGIS